MAFFKKLKDRLFNSSSKIDEGLEAIVEDGGTQDAGEPLAIEPPQPVLTTPEPAAPEPEEGVGDTHGDAPPQDLKEALAQPATDIAEHVGQQMTPRVEPDEPPAPPPLDTAPEAKAPEAAKPVSSGACSGGEERKNRAQAAFSMTTCSSSSKSC